MRNEDSKVPCDTLFSSDLTTSGKEGCLVVEMKAQNHWKYGMFPSWALQCYHMKKGLPHDKRNGG
ncbi:hypothetical protein MTR_8g077095 [Medicago truncatula]|uniref:Uncharacterized protein n=1 Tax=Medicago truncatula TaxID=3880 RepID=A0A072TSN8_MEDTR|nr:hypothetical protein MTR_8g077095 [Medicago truncatula]